MLLLAASLLVNAALAVVITPGYHNFAAFLAH